MHKYFINCKGLSKPEISHHHFSNSLLYFVDSPPPCPRQPPPSWLSHPGSACRTQVIPGLQEPPQACTLRPRLLLRQGRVIILGHSGERGALSAWFSGRKTFTHHFAGLGTKSKRNSHVCIRTLVTGGWEGTRLRAGHTNPLLAPSAFS